MAKSDEINTTSSKPEKYGSASGGLNLQKLDNKSRIFIGASMRSYFADRYDGNPICWVGYFSDLKTPCLILMSDTIHDQIAETNREHQLLNFNRLDNLDLENTYEGYTSFHPVEIKSNRIQLTIGDRGILDLPENDKRIVVAGIGSMIHVWPLGIFKERYPKPGKFLEGD